MKATFLFYYFSRFKLKGINLFANITLHALLQPFHKDLNIGKDCATTKHTIVNVCNNFSLCSLSFAHTNMKAKSLYP